MDHALKTDPFWWEAAPRPEAEPEPLPARADAVVVGAGFTGLGAALTLARAGRRVAVLEKDRPGEGASSRNGGIASGNLRKSFHAMIRDWGLERARQVMAEGQAARADLARFIADEEIDCDWKLTGRFTGAMRPHHYEALARECELLNRHLDIGAWMVPKAEQHGEIGSDLYHGGMARPDIGGLHPGKLHRGLLERALAAGAEVHGRTARHRHRRRRRREARAHGARLHRRPRGAGRHQWLHRPGDALAAPAHRADPEPDRGDRTPSRRRSWTG